MSRYTGWADDDIACFCDEDDSCYCFESDSYESESSESESSESEDSDSYPLDMAEPRHRHATSSRPKATFRHNTTSQARHKSSSNGAMAGIAKSNVLWPSERCNLRVRFLDGDKFDHETVKSCVTKHYNSIPMRIRFRFLEPGDPEHSDIRITFTSESKCLVGRSAEDHRGEPTMWLNMHRNSNLEAEARRAKRQYDILHEFGHALGMQHEHQHPECKANWNMQVLQAKNGWSAEKVHRNFDRLTQGVKLAAYDPESIMHYPVDLGDTHSLVTYVPQATKLSEGDKKFLMAIYPKPMTVAKTPRIATKNPYKQENDDYLVQRLTAHLVMQYWMENAMLEAIKSEERRRRRAQKEMEMMNYFFGPFMVNQVVLVPCYYWY